MNYIDDLAALIYREIETDPAFKPDEHLKRMYRIYAVLALSKGMLVTPRDVHDAWAAHIAGYDAKHHTLVPFDELTPDAQAVNEPYVNAIHAVVRQIATREAERRS